MAKDQRASFNTEDWWAVWMGLLIFLLCLGRPFLHADLLGWVTKVSVFTSLPQALSTSGAGVHLPAVVSLLLTYLFVTVLVTVAGVSMGAKAGRFFLAFTIIFWLTYACWIVGHWAYIAATPETREKLGVGWSLSLTGEAGYILALLVGLIVGNVFKGLTRFLGPAAKPECFIKTAIVILGAVVGIKTFQAFGLTRTIFFRGLCAIVEAYLIYWPVVYLVARKWFKLTPEWAAPLASGISICGVSAAIATAGAIRARPVVPIVVSSLVIVFAVVELIILPFAAQTWLYKEPMVAGAWMGLAVKTDGAAAASGAVVDALIRAKALAAQGINYEKDWMLTTAVTTKIFIDIFIGIWAFVLAMVWIYAVEKRRDRKVPAVEIWYRFPKFVLGYGFAFLAVAALGLAIPVLAPGIKAGVAGANSLRQIFFALTFFCIGVISDFSALKKEGMGKLALIYFLCLFGFIVWVGLGISYLFFHGVTPPVIP